MRIYIRYANACSLSQNSPRKQIAKPSRKLIARHIPTQTSVAPSMINQIVLERVYSASLLRHMTIYRISKCLLCQIKTSEEGKQYLRAHSSAYPKPGIRHKPRSIHVPQEGSRARLPYPSSPRHDNPAQTHRISKCLLLSLSIPKKKKTKQASSASPGKPQTGKPLRPQIHSVQANQIPLRGFPTWPHRSIMTDAAADLISAPLAIPERIPAKRKQSTHHPPPSLPRPTPKPAIRPTSRSLATRTSAPPSPSRRAHISHPPAPPRLPQTSRQDACPLPRRATPEKRPAISHLGTGTGTGTGSGTAQHAKHPVARLRPALLAPCDRPARLPGLRRHESARQKPACSYPRGLPTRAAPAAECADTRGRRHVRACVRGMCV